MHTVHPSIMLGSYIWDEERLPRDEFDIRLQCVRDAIAANGWAGAIVYGDAREHAALAWLTNFIPRMRWAMGLFPASGDPRILASISSRDIPAMRAMTMIENVKSGWEWKWFDEWVASLDGGGAIGVVNLDQITPLLLGSMGGSLGGRFELVGADEFLRRARERHRPRELAVIREAAEIARATRQSFVAAWIKGLDVEHCALAAERTARELAVQDVRTLVSRDAGRTLEPFRASFNDRPTHLLAYVAVKYLGYWADSFVSVGAPALVKDAANNALKVLISGLGSGASVRDVAGRAMSKLGKLKPHPVLSDGFGGRIGLSLAEGEPVRADGIGPLQTGVVYSLKAGAVDDRLGGHVASAMVMRKADGTIETVLPEGMD